MAIFHLRLSIVSRAESKNGGGCSAVGRAAYRSGEKITNEYDGITHDYSRRKCVVHSEILLPENAPKKYYDRSTLWNSVELIEKNGNAQLARDVEIALPRELDRETQIKLAREFVQNTFVNEGMCADIAIHDKHSKSQNPHAHILLTMRPLTENGEWGAKSRKEYLLDEKGQKIPQKSGGYKSKHIDTVDWNDPGKAEAWRSAWSDLVNRYLEERGISERIDHRSYKRQGVDKIPTIHMGAAATAMEKKGIRTDHGDINREIATINREKQERKAYKSRANKYRRLYSISDQLPKLLDQKSAAETFQSFKPLYKQYISIADKKEKDDFYRQYKPQINKYLQAKKALPINDEHKIRADPRIFDREIKALLHKAEELMDNLGIEHSEEQKSLLEEINSLKRQVKAREGNEASRQDTRNDKWTKGR